MKRLRTFIGYQLFFIVLFVSVQEAVQAQEASDKVKTSKKLVGKKGEISGYWRTFLMVTQNEGSLKDWTTLATGGMLKYETPRFKNCQLGVAYYTSHNLNINEINEPDVQTNQGSRYGLGLFNVRDANQRTIQLLGELYLKYGTQKHSVTIGRMKLKSPLMNPQDGRMIPTLEQGIWYHNQLIPHTTIQLGWISHIAPRSFDRYLTVAESIGVYPLGRNIDGTGSGYRNQLTSKGLGMAQVKFTNKTWGAEVWNYYVENIFNTLFAEAHLKGKLGGLPWKLSGQIVQQNQLNRGGNEELNKAFFQTKEARLWGAQLQLIPQKKLTISINYNHIGKEGRFLFPREWGREFLFTFQRRERNEGTGNAHAWTTQVTKTWYWAGGHKLKVNAGYGHYYRPSAEDVTYNKYALPANSQTNFGILYHVGGALKGMRLEYLVAYKRLLDNTVSNPRFIINRVNMWNHNLVLNYQF